MPSIPLSYSLPFGLIRHLKGMPLVDPLLEQEFWRSHSSLCQFDISEHDAVIYLSGFHRFNALRDDKARKKKGKIEYRKIRRFEGTALGDKMRNYVSKIYASDYMGMYIKLLLYHLKNNTNKSGFDRELNTALDHYLQYDPISEVYSYKTHGPEVTRRRSTQDRLRRLEDNYDEERLQAASRNIFNTLRKISSEPVRLLLSNRCT